MSLPAPDRVPRTGLELRDWLVQRFPGLAQPLGDPWYYPDDGAYTPHAVCSAFTDIYLRHIADYSAPEVVELFRVTEAILAADPHKTGEVANALCTCFLENISCTDAGHAARPLMGVHSLRFFDGWHYPYLRRLGLEPYVAP